MQVKSVTSAPKIKLFSGKTSFSSFVVDDTGGLLAFGDNYETLLGLISKESRIPVPTRVPFEGKIAQVSSLSYRDIMMVACEGLYRLMGGSTVVLDEDGYLWGTTERAMRPSTKGLVEMPTIFRNLRFKDTSPFRFDKITYDYHQELPFKSFSLGYHGVFCIDIEGGVWLAHLRAYWNLLSVPGVPPACRVEDSFLCTAIETIDGAIWCVFRDENLHLIQPRLCKTDGVSFPLRGMSSCPERVFALDGQGKIWETCEQEMIPFRSLPVGNAPLPQFVSLSVGFAHLLALDESGFVWSCSLKDRCLKPCTGRSGDVQTLQKIEELGGGNLAVCCGAFHSLVLDASQTIVAFGFNTDGQLGLGHTEKIDHPTPHSASQ